MFTPTALVLLALGAPPGPTVPSRDYSEELQWKAVLACPRIQTTTGTYGSATGVTIGFKEGFAYVLTAAHAVPGEESREVHYFTKESYPARDKTFAKVQVILRLPAPDVALLKVPVRDWHVEPLKLAQPGQRPKSFPSLALSVGCTNANAPTCTLERLRAKRLVRRMGSDIAFFWESESATLAGRSGGPLLNQDGRIIGLCAAAQSGRGYYTHLDEILAGLKKSELGWLWVEK